MTPTITPSAVELKWTHPTQRAVPIRQSLLDESSLPPSLIHQCKLSNMTWRASLNWDTANPAEITFFTTPPKLPNCDRSVYCMTFDIKSSRVTFFQFIMRYVSNFNIVCDIRLQQAHEFAFVWCGKTEVAIKQRAGVEVIMHEYFFERHSTFPCDFEDPLGGCKHFWRGGAWCSTRFVVYDSVKLREVTLWNCYSK